MEHPSPTPDEIRAGRERVGWSFSGAAAAVLVTERAWRNWEAGKRKMSPGLWRLFTAMTGRSTVAYQTSGGRVVLRLHVEKPRNEEVSTGIIGTNVEN